MDRLILPGAFGFTRLGYELRQWAWPSLDVSLQGKTVVITGATSGLGRSAAFSLAGLGARLVLVGRDREKTENTRDEISKTTGNDQVIVQLADLSLMAEVHELAERLLRDEPQIDVLINNAAVLPARRTLTTEGLELTFATDLLSPYLLTVLLIPRLRKSAPARIVNVLSGGMYFSGIDVGNLQNEKGRFDGSRAYARAKRGLMILTEQWADELRESRVTVNAMHPGWADTPGVEGSLPGFYKVTRSFLRTAEQGSDTIVWLAAAPEVSDTSGQFWLDREPHVTTVLPCTGGTPAERRDLRKTLEGYVEETMG